MFTYLVSGLHGHPFLPAEPVPRITPVWYQREFSWSTRGRHYPIHSKVFNNLSVMVTSVHQGLHDQCSTSHLAPFQRRDRRRTRGHVSLPDCVDGFVQMSE